MYMQKPEIRELDYNTMKGQSYSAEIHSDKFLSIEPVSLPSITMSRRQLKLWNSAENRNYVDEELQNANHWATIGLGITGYYNQGREQT